MTSDFDPKRLETTHDYYRSLQRAPDANAFSRAATVLSIAEGVLLPNVYWTSNMLGDQVPLAEEFGWGEEMWKEGWVSFAEVAFDAGAFSGSSLERLRDVPRVADHNDTAEDARAFSVYHLIRAKV